MYRFRIGWRVKCEMKCLCEKLLRNMDAGYVVTVNIGFDSETLRSKL